MVSIEKTLKRALNIFVKIDLDFYIFIILIMNSYLVGNNLELLEKVNSNSIDLVYFDPPYNTGRDFFNFNDKFKIF